MPHLVLKNPHSALAVFDTRPQDVFEVRLERGRPGDAWQQVADRARQAGVTVHQAAGGPTKPQRGEGQRGGGSEAVVRERQGIELDQLFAKGGTASGLWLGLDQLHWSVPDPVPVNTKAAYDAVIDELDRRVSHLAARVN